jgi:hypothetical protein
MIGSPLRPPAPEQDGDRAALRRRVEEIKAQMRPLLEWGSGNSNGTCARSPGTS